MEMKLRKLWPLVGAMCLGLTSSVFAHSTTQNGSTSTYGSSMDSSSQSAQGSYQRGTFREITPAAGPRVAHGADVFITADFIWWKASEEGLAFSGSGVNAGDTTLANVYSSPAKGKVVSVGEDWAPGFKVGLGLNMGHDGWDILAQYTWLHASDSRTQSGDFVYAPESLPFDDGPTIAGTKNTSNWDLKFNVIDLELGRNFYLSQFLTMRPHIGLKGTWQDHDWKSKYFVSDYTVSAQDAAGANVDVPFTGPFHNDRRFEVWGIGVRGGFNVAWYMSKDWSIYGDLALASLWTNYYKSTQKIDLDDTTTGNTRGFINVDNDNVYTCKSIIELELGLRWETWFYDDNYHFAIQAGWEQQTWMGWSAFGELLDTVYHDFSVQGLNLKFRFDF
ncbi:MAG: hypothetical protein KFB93_00530 [Simkaniaceae bacterium]|jgi:hypothetical protein|nr:MAG: hypothetical protein KFB93_00530 [Simkaniaceae bacterium]